MRNRNAYYGLIHKGATALLSLNQMLKQDADTVYRDWLQSKTGKRSCTLLTDKQLTALKRELESKGALPKTTHKAGPNNPTQQQFNKLAAVVNAKGWDGLTSPELASFIRRTTKNQALSVYQLDRRQMSNVITGLEKWHVE